tara:strand:+ start:38 stop:271 length:234 start_codon:yes stop_codon:yes gene_type:complete
MSTNNTSKEDRDFIYKHIESILDVPGDLSSGINGCILASAYSRACNILESNGSNKPNIVHTIDDPECELTYLVENGQ